SSACAVRFCVFPNDPAPPEIYTLSLHDALPICRGRGARPLHRAAAGSVRVVCCRLATRRPAHRSAAGDAAVERLSPGSRGGAWRSEDHTSELQSLTNLVCRLLLEKKKAHIVTRT